MTTSPGKTAKTAKTGKPGMTGGAARALGRRRTADTATDPSHRPGGMIASLQQQHPDGLVVQQVPLSAIAAHPDNRVHSGVGDIDDLAASIQALGVLEPVLLAPAEDYLQARPGHRPVVGDRPYVLIAGERRHAASVLAGKDTIPAIVRADLTGTDGLAAMVAENMHRQGMHPLDEAALFSLQVELGASQRQIAERTGCSQAHVSKRLALLRLPQPAQDALGAGVIDLSDAQALGRLSAQDQASAWARFQDAGGSLAATAGAVAAETREQTAEAELRTELLAEGITVVNVHEILGEDPERFRLVTDEAVRQAANEGRLLVDVSGGQRRNYFDGRQDSPSTTAPQRRTAPEAPGAGQDTAGSADGVSDQAERVKARTARLRACKRACAGRPSAALLHDGLLQAALWRTDLHAHAVVDLAGHLLSQSEPLAETDGTEVGADGWLWALRQDPDETVQRRAGWALLLAARELRARETHRDWDALDANHLNDLVSVAGYRPTAWEQARLDAVTKAPYQSGLQTDAATEDQ